MKKKSPTITCKLLNKYKETFLLIMKRSLILVILFFSITASSFSQKITLELGKVKLSKVLKSIKKKTNTDFFYSDNELDVDQMVIANYIETDILEIVSDLVGTRFKVEQSSDNIMLITPVVIKTFQNTIAVTGNVTNENGEVLPGVTILEKGTSNGATTNFDGNYSINVDEQSTLTFSYVGYETQEIKVDNQTVINIKLKEDISKLAEVVITGVVQREKESFTGAVNTVTREELKTVGNLNVIQSLKTLDPSFIVADNNVFGSNPNILPNIEVRGQTSLTTSGLNDEFGANPNQPLFVLNGFETTLRDIVDLDMNRVASITILKDATSTALYGAKAANGVVVVETLRPASGKLRVSYNADFRIESPDLSDYNLMDAEQKLEFERLAGRWTHPFSFSTTQQFELDEQYNSILAEVRRGVDTYWLSQPLQVATTLGHSIYVNGGDDSFTYGVGLNYKKINGIMIGSDRANWGGSIDLNYRKNKLNISNILYINGSDANESPYGSFSNFAQANPYYRITDENGNITKFLDRDTNVPINGFTTDFDVINPLFNQTLNPIDNTDDIKIQNNLRAIWTFSDKFRLQTNFQLARQTETQVKFLPTEHTDFINTSLFESGSYTNIRTDRSSYRFNIMGTYATTFGEKNRLTANLRAEAEETENKRLGVAAVGFPVGVIGNPAFAFSYEPDARPLTASSLYRRVNVLGSVNYSYDNTYLFDATYRLDGSTTFGNNERFSPFWAIGVGYNMHNALNLNSDVVQKLKFRANIGSTGNQSFGNSIVTTSVYGFNNITNIFGQGVFLQTLDNPDLKWQTTLDSSFGLEGTFFNNRLNIEYNIFNKKTDPLVVSIDLPSSTGVNAYPLNAGNLNTKGMEVNLRFSPIYNIENEIVWTIGYTALLLDSKYDGFNQTLNSLNENEITSQSLIRFRDGFSPDDIWAVPSLGIDPANGREVFATKEGGTSYEYSSNDEIVIGSTRPDVEGVISSNFRIKNFSLGLNLRYRLGGDIYNYALYNKVENISSEGITQNQDVRALFDRWKNPGDITRFKSISITDFTPISSRFIQKENVILGESINLAYDFSNSKWVDHLGLSRLRLSAYMNDIFRISTVKVERGIEYPFARAISFSLNASF